MRMTRWTGFGQDRLYVRGEDDEAVGWWDLLTDEGHPETATRAGTLADAVAEWRAIESAANQAGPADEQGSGVAAAPAPTAGESAEELDLDLESPECVRPMLPGYSTN